LHHDSEKEVSKNSVSTRIAAARDALTYYYNAFQILYMINMFNTSAKKIVTGIFVTLVLGLTYFLIRNDGNKIGACVSCCSSGGAKVCKSNFSKTLCQEYNHRLVDGRSWNFIETPEGRCPD
jgi:hypothetical protein